jgi:PAS domain S-box-containing protein
MGWQMHPAVVPLLIVTGVALTIIVAFARRRAVPGARDAVFEHLSDAVIVIDGRGRVIDANRAGRVLAGTRADARDRIRGRPAAVVFPGLWAAVDTTGPGETAPFEVALRVNGRMVEYDVRTTTVHHSGPGPARAILARDIADRKESERALVHAKEAAEAASRAKSTFLANMSHELRTPLTLIIGYGEMLAESLGAAGRVEDGEQADVGVKSAHHLLGIINEILDLSKIEAGRLDLAPRGFDGDAFAEDLRHAAEGLAREHGNTFHVEAFGRLGELRTDPVRLKQILLSLLSNACQYTEGGFVRLAYVREGAGGAGDWVSFRVVDTGAGIPSDQVDRLFQPFSRAESAASRGVAGAGLGLAVSRKLAGMMGGSITVISTPNVGSSFTLRVPASLPDPRRAGTA